MTESHVVKVRIVSLFFHIHIKAKYKNLFFTVAGTVKKV